MDPQVSLFIGAAIGAVVIGLFGSAYLAWRDGGKLLDRPKQIGKENQERLRKAKEEAAKGRRKQMQALFALFMALFILIILMLIAGGIREGSL